MDRSSPSNRNWSRTSAPSDRLSGDINMIRKSASILFPVLLSGLLAACAGLNDGGRSASSEDQVLALDRGDAGNARTSARVAPADRPVADRHAGEFVGGSRRDLVAWLGQPDLELREGGRSLLQFRQGQCVMLAMVEDGDSVAAVEMSGVDQVTDARCANSAMPKVMTQ